jgi:hypothetical protein
MWHIWGRKETHTGFWWGNVKERDNFEDLGIDRSDIKMDLKKNMMGGCGLD